MSELKYPYNAACSSPPYSALEPSGSSLLFGWKPLTDFIWGKASPGPSGAEPSGAMLADLLLHLIEPTKWGMVFQWFFSARLSAWNSVENPVTTAVPKAEPGVLGGQWTPSKMGVENEWGLKQWIIRSWGEGEGRTSGSLVQERPQSVISSPP